MEHVRVWAKVKRIERVNPLFPTEAGHELAATQTDPLDTVLSLSREMVTAVCQVLGFEREDKRGKLDHLRYPAKPATSAYRPDADDIGRVVLGDLQDERKRHRAINLATLANRRSVAVKVDGHAIVTRHLAILAMTGAGKSWTARRIIEELARKNYPIVIFDPHGDYTGLASVEELQGKVQRYHAQFPIFEEDNDAVARVVSDLSGWELTGAMQNRVGEVLDMARRFYVDDPDERRDRETWLYNKLGTPQEYRFSLQRDLFLVANLAEAAELTIRSQERQGQQELVNWGWANLPTYSGTDARTLEGLKKRLRMAAKVLRRMEELNRKVAGSAVPLPQDRTQLVRYGGISVVSLAGYTGDFRATIYSLVADDLFSARVRGDLKMQFLMVLEEAHNYAPAHVGTAAEGRAIGITKQIAQEGRKFGVGLVLISQRPSRLDETTLSQCNSFVIMRMVNPADQNFVRKVIETLGEDEAKMLPDLDVGEALLSGQMINFPVLARIEEPKSQGEHEEEDAFEALDKAHKEQEAANGTRTSSSRSAGSRKPR